MEFLGSFSADMYDLVKPEERKRLLTFAEDFFQAIENRVVTSKTFRPLEYSDFEYNPGEPKEKTETSGIKVVILTDSEDTNTNLGKMIERFRQSISSETQMYNLNNVKITGACQGCRQCGLDNVCIYQGQDEYIDFYNSKVTPADLLVFAGNIVDRYLSSRWKLSFDRSFSMGIRLPLLENK